MAKQHRSLELKSVSLACDYSVAECVGKDSKLIKLPSGKKGCVRLRSLMSIDCEY